MAMALALALAFTGRRMIAMNYDYKKIPTALLSGGFVAAMACSVWYSV